MKFNVVGIGEILWDVLPDGKQLGGAPANFSLHTKNLGANSTIISAIGSDDLGNEIQTILSERNLNRFLNFSKYPTGKVSVSLKNGIPDYLIHEPVAWDEILIDNKAISGLKLSHAICFGTLAQRSETSRLTIREVLRYVGGKVLKIYDVNLRQPYYSKDIISDSLYLANILKLSGEELEILTGFFNLSEISEVACTQMLFQFDLKMVALTNGSRNSILVTQDENINTGFPKGKSC